MKAKLEWDDSYSANDPEIDTQHQRLFKIINSIPDKFDEHQARQIVLMFISYACEHFLTEEEMMKDIEYPNLEKHQEIHADLLLELANIAADNFPNKKSLVDLKQFISDWMNNHFLVDDMDYVAFTKKKNSIVR